MLTSNQTNGQTDSRNRTPAKSGRGNNTI